MQRSLVRWRQRVGGASCALLLAAQWGCHTYLPVQSTPVPVDQRGAVLLTDRGRLLLSDKLGASVEQLEGIVLAQDSAKTVLAVSSIKDVRGGSALWSGESVEIPSEAILGYRPRVFSKPRTFLFAGLAVAAAIAVVFGMTLNVFGDDTSSGEVANPPGVPPGTSFRAPGVLPGRP